jgi:hypothetical protein
MKKLGSECVKMLKRHTDREKRYLFIFGEHELWLNL